MLPIASFSVTKKVSNVVSQGKNCRNTRKKIMATKKSNENLNQDTKWQNDMLKRLQNSAAPVPIKVACTVTPPGKPEYLGEEYHGSITKEEEKKILEGKNGRYIVRDSFTSTRPNEFTLAFNFDESLQYIKLVYNPGTKQFRTDSNASNSGFKSVLDLITDVINLYQKLKAKDSSYVAGISKKQKGTYNKSHKFKTHSYKHPKWCDVCGNFLWGIINQGDKCVDCGINCHKSCCNEAPMPCAPITHNKRAAENDRMSRKKSSNTDNVDPSYIVISPRNPVFDQCNYFQRCSQFISAFNIRDGFIDMRSNLTRCFCNNCITNTTSYATQTNISVKHLKEWTRFQFEWQEDKLKRDLENWEVVYFAANPKFVRNLIKGFFNPPAIEEIDDFHVVPSLAYTTQDMVNENWSYQFNNTSTGETQFAQTVLEVYLRPDSYEVISADQIMDEEISVGEDGEPAMVPVHWKAKYKRDLYPKSILVKIFEKN